MNSCIMYVHYSMNKHESGFETYHRLVPETDLCHVMQLALVLSLCICSGVPYNIFADFALGMDAS